MTEKPKTAADTGGLRTFLEGLRDRTTPNGVPLGTRLKVVGEDALPAGAFYGSHTVTLTGGTLDGWDLGGRGLVVRGRVHLMNLLSTWMPGVAPLYPIEIAVGGDIEWAENLEFMGPIGANGRPGAVLNSRSSGSGVGYRTGLVRMVRRSRFEGFPADHFKLHGVPGGVQVIEESYFGPQWAPAGSKAHADAFTTVAAQGMIHLRRNLIDWTDAGHPAGLTNIFRICRNTGSTTPLERVRIEENLCFYGPSRSYPVQVSGKAGGFVGPVEFVNNWIGPKIASRGTRHYFHPSTHGAVALWAGNIDALTGAPVPGPTGATMS